MQTLGVCWECAIEINRTSFSSKTQNAIAGFWYFIRLHNLRKMQVFILRGDILLPVYKLFDLTFANFESKIAYIHIYEAQDKILKEGVGVFHLV